MSTRAASPLTDVKIRALPQLAEDRGLEQFCHQTIGEAKSITFRMTSHPCADDREISAQEERFASLVQHVALRDVTRSRRP